MQQFKVTGMSCAACSARVEKAVGAVPGVTSVAVSLLTNSMGVEGTATAEAIIEAVEKAGYGASLKSSGSASSGSGAAGSDVEGVAAGAGVAGSDAAGCGGADDASGAVVVVSPQAESRSAVKRTIPSMRATPLFLRFFIIRYTSFRDFSHIIGDLRVEVFGAAGQLLALLPDFLRRALREVAACREHAAGQVIDLNIRDLRKRKRRRVACNV